MGHHFILGLEKERRCVGLGWRYRSQSPAPGGKCWRLHGPAGREGLSQSTASGAPLDSRASCDAGL